MKKKSGSKTRAIHTTSQPLVPSQLHPNPIQYIYLTNIRTRLPHHVSLRELFYSPLATDHRRIKNQGVRQQHTFQFGGRDLKAADFDEFLAWHKYEI